MVRCGSDAVICHIRQNHACFIIVLVSFSFTLNTVFGALLSAFCRNAAVASKIYRNDIPPRSGSVEPLVQPVQCVLIGLVLLSAVVYGETVGLSKFHAKDLTEVKVVGLLFLNTLDMLF